MTRHQGRRREAEARARVSTPREVLTWRGSVGTLVFGIDDVSMEH
jgi:hypothetical protein